MGQGKPHCGEKRTDSSGLTTSHRWASEKVEGLLTAGTSELRIELFESRASHDPGMKFMSLCLLHFTCRCR